MSETEPSLQARLVITKLAIERSRCLLAHLLALTHLYGPSCGLVAGSMVHIIASLDQELSSSADMLDIG